MSSPVELGEEYVAKLGSGLTVRCIEGYDGGLPIHSYQLEVVGDEDDGSILLNRTVAAGINGPTFEVAGLAAGRSYRLFLYAVNAKGRSEPAVLEPVTLKGAAMYTTGTFDLPNILTNYVTSLHMRRSLYRGVTVMKIFINLILLYFIRPFRNSLTLCWLID